MTDDIPERALIAFSDRYIRCLDDRALEAWPGFFLDDGLYNILPRENFEDGFETSLMILDSNGSRRDRVMCIRDVIIHQPVINRHFVSGFAIERLADGTIAMRSNFMVAQSDLEGYGKLFAVGEYRDVIVEKSGAFMFRERIVILDNFTVPSQLIDPL